MIKLFTLSLQICDSYLEGYYSTKFFCCTMCYSYSVLVPTFDDSCSDDPRRHSGDVMIEIVGVVSLVSGLSAVVTAGAPQRVTNCICGYFYKQTARVPMLHTEAKLLHKIRPRLYRHTPLQGARSFQRHLMPYGLFTTKVTICVAMFFSAVCVACI